MFGAINTDNSRQVGGNVSVLQQDGSGNLKVATASSTDNQRVSAQAGDFADGAIVTLGALADAAQTGDNAGSVNAHLRGLNKSLTPTTLADNLANPTVPQVGAFLLAWNGSTWDRIEDYFPSADSIPTRNGMATVDQLLLWNGASWDRWESDATGKARVSLYVKTMNPGDTALTLGQALAASSIPVVLPASQIGGSGLALENGGNLASAKNDLDTIAAAQVAQGSTTSGQNGPLMQAAVTTSSPTYTNGQTSPVTQTPSGGVRVSQSGTWTVQPGNAANTTPWLFQLQSAQTTFISAGTTGNTVIKGTPGTFFGIFASTVGAGGGLVYDNATTNSGTPVGSAPTAIGFDQGVPAQGVACANGITVAGSATNPALTVFWR